MVFCWEIIRIEDIMKFHLVVLKPFDVYKRGDMITDAESVQKVLAGPQASFVVRVSARGN